jgi:2-oxoglutarate ferredoxin oxidoreductase subunit beta
MQRTGVVSAPFPPLAVAIALGCGFVARALATNVEHTADMMVQAIAHKGFALVDILQPCVTFNRKNTAKWYGERTYILPPGHDAADRGRAFELAMETEERIPLGILYRKERPSLEEMHPGVGEPPLHSRETRRRHPRTDPKRSFPLAVPALNYIPIEEEKRRRPWPSYSSR